MLQMLGQRDESLYPEQPSNPPLESVALMAERQLLVHWLLFVVKAAAGAFFRVNIVNNKDKSMFSRLYLSL